MAGCLQNSISNSVSVQKQNLSTFLDDNVIFKHILHILKTDHSDNDSVSFFYVQISKIKLQHSQITTSDFPIIFFWAQFYS